jgi:hypothetical protein
MGIKRSKTIVCIVLIFSLNIFTLIGKTYGNDENQSSLINLHDKVHTFLASNSTLSLTVEFEKNYWHYVLVEIVTEHDCKVNITIIDPDNKEYDSFDGQLSFNPEVSRYVSIPHCAASNGHYTILTSVKNEYTLNMHVKIEKSTKVFSDSVFDSFGDDDPLPPRVSKWKDGMEIVHDMRLKTDTMYKVYFSRVSSISNPEKTKCTMNCTIEDPNNLDASIVLNNIDVKMDAITQKYFGTAAAGLYRLRLRIKCDADYVNIAYAVVEDYQISDAVNSSDSPSDPSGNAPTESHNETNMDDVGNLSATTNRNISYYIPQELMIGTVSVIGGLAGTMAILMVVYRKKNKVNLNS